jgi:tRNA nucleotidyltransferase (CCA-adding enzyme)
MIVSGQSQSGVAQAGGVSSELSGVTPPPSGAAVLERLRELPGGLELLDVAGGRDDAELIGGAVRDIVLDPHATPRELDVVVADDAAGFAEALADALGAPTEHSPAGQRPLARVHERFRTARVSSSGGQIDVATRRSERYPEPGALPIVADGTREQDIARRDFTVNTLAVALSRPRQGELLARPDALEDLAAGRLRVLHDASFRDDPTRLMRMARYSARLGFEPDEHTASLAADAIAAGALDTVSPARIGAELRLALAEPDPVAALESLAQLGVLTALHQALTLDPAVARAALDVLPPLPDAWPDVLLLAALLLPAHTFDTTDYETRLRVLLDGWEIPAAERERAVHSTILAPRLATRLERAQKPSEIYDVAHGEPLEAVALASALAEAGAEADGSDVATVAAQRWLAELRLVELEINGSDLLAAGVAAGPDVGRRLRRALMRKLDGELSGRDGELQAALADA